MFITNFGVFIHAYSLQPQTYYTRTKPVQQQIAEYDIKSEYSEEYSTIDKTGSEKPLVSKSYFLSNLLGSETFKSVFFVLRLSTVCTCFCKIRELS